MAQGDLVVFQEANAYMLDGGFTAADVIKVALITATPTPVAGTVVPGMAASATTTFTEIAAGGNYVAGGETLDTWGNMIIQSGATMTFADTGATVIWVADVSSPTTAVYAVVYNSSDTLQRAICFIDLNNTAAVNMTSGDLTITWDASGIFATTIA